MTTNNSNGGRRREPYYREPYLPPGPSGAFPAGYSVTADGETLLRQAPMAANDYLMSAIGHIDNELGGGYAAKHPELIAAFMRTAALDMEAAVIARAIETLGHAVDNAAQSLSAAIGAAGA